MLGLYRLKSILSDKGFWLVLLVALSLRLYHIGAQVMFPDEANLLYWSYRMAQGEEFLWLSNNPIGWSGSGFPFKQHSPFLNYIISFWYLFTSNPMVVRALMAGLSVLGILLLYVTLKRYFGQRMALMSGLFLAVLSSLIYWHRLAFNLPVLGFLMPLSLMSGLLGYYENRPRWMVVHGISTALAGQYHPSYILLSPISLALYAWNWRHYVMTHRRMLQATLLGLLLGILTFLPWVYGTLNPDLNPHIVANCTTCELNSTSTNIIQHIYFNLSANLGSIDLVNSQAFLVMLGIYGLPFLMSPIVYILMLLMPFSLTLGMLSSIIYWLKAILSKKRFEVSIPLSVFISIVIIMLASLIIFEPSRTSIWYFYLLPYGAVVCLAWIFDYWMKLSKIVARFITVVIALIILGQLGALAQWIDYLNNLKYDDPLMSPMQNSRNMLEELASEAPHEIVLILDELYGLVFSNTTFYTYHWSIAGAGLPVRLVERSQNQGIPIATNQDVLLLGTRANSILPRIFSDHFESLEMLGQAFEDGEATFYKASFNVSDLPPLDIRPTTANKFTTGAQILGAYAENAPQAGQDWRVTLVWQPQIAPSAGRYQFSLRVLDDTGNRIVQVDLHSLEPHLWRLGDTVINPFTLSLPPDAQLSEQVRLELVMYEVDGRAQDIIAEDGSLQGQLMGLVWRK